jgi:stage II sporulation protein R
MKTKIIALFCACFMLLTAVDMIIPRSEAEIFDNVIRLHILAADNSDEAQKIKLTVRDAILDECGDVFSESGDIVTASEKVEETIPRIERIANRVLLENGVDYCASVEWGSESYPTRVYEDFYLPKGTYRSLRVNLGDANGNNWWCVLFPPLCTKAASDSEFESAGISKKDTSVFKSRKYIFRFKLLELFGD